MARAPRWTADTKLHRVQFDWEDGPTARPVRLASRFPREGQSARVGMAEGVEVECLIVRLASGVLYVKLAKVQDTEGNRAASRL